MALIPQLLRDIFRGPFPTEAEPGPAPIIETPQDQLDRVIVNGVQRIYNMLDSYAKEEETDAG